MCNVRGVTGPVPWGTLLGGGVGIVGTGLGTWLNNRHGIKLARLKDHLDRAQQRENCCRDLIAASYALRSTPTGINPAPTQAAIAEFRRAAAGVQLSIPELADGPLAAALSAAENLAKSRTTAAWSASTTEAESAYDEAMAVLLARMRSSLNLPSQ